jgi:hypothetical protein
MIIPRGSSCSARGCGYIGHIKMNEINQMINRYQKHYRGRLITAHVILFRSRISKLQLKQSSRRIELSVLGIRLVGKRTSLVANVSGASKVPSKELRKHAKGIAKSAVCKCNISAKFTEVKIIASRYRSAIGNRKHKSLKTEKGG